MVGWALGGWAGLGVLEGTDGGLQDCQYGVTPLHGAAQVAQTAWSSDNAALLALRLDVMLHACSWCK
jgi:hypothetical protein